MPEPAPVRPSFPRGPLYGAAAVVAFTLIAVGGVRVAGVGSVERPAGEAVESREIRFVDRDDGAVVVYDTGHPSPIAVMEAGTNGFVRGALRGLARQRRLSDIGQAPPFLLTRWQDGSLSLEDTATGQRVYLEAFGATQVATFAELLTAEVTP